MYRLDNLKTKTDYPVHDLPDLVIRKLNIPGESLENLKILRRSLDARKKPELYVVYSLTFTLNNPVIAARLVRQKKIVPWSEPEDPPVQEGTLPLTWRPVVAGSGPAGLFCAWMLAEYGYRPLVLERGQDMIRRVRAVRRFWQEGTLDPGTNVQFGEGGAGTFSDGKLTSRSRDTRVRRVLETLVSAGAPERILYENKPHVGTGTIRRVVVTLRKRIEILGGTFRFGARVSGLTLENGRVREVEINGSERIPVSLLVLATGHSARDTYRMLEETGVSLTPKEFAVGFRIEHPQEMIDRNQYGAPAPVLGLGSAEYALKYQDRETGRGVYSFCMCPGGQVVAAASESGRLCTNGMSYASRSGLLANSALVVTTGPGDYPGEDPLAGIRFQEMLEERAYRLGGGDYHAPAQRASSYLTGQSDETLPEGTYRPGVRPADLREILPEEMAGALARALQHFDGQIPGFAGSEALLTAVESRTSSPVRIVRGPEMTSPGVENLYPVGEGAGYAGGIVSAAIDGMKAAEIIIGKYRRFD